MSHQDYPRYLHVVGGDRFRGPPHCSPLVVNDTDEDVAAGSDDDDDDDSSDEDADNKPAAVTDAPEGSKPDGNQGGQRL